MMSIPQAPGDAFADRVDEQQQLQDMQLGGDASQQAYATLNGAMFMVNTAELEEAIARNVDSCVVRLRGLPFYVTEQEVRAFVDGYPIDQGEGALVIIPFGNGRGDGYIRFASVEVANHACRDLNRRVLGSRYIELLLSSEAVMVPIRNQVLQRQSALSSNRVLRLRGLPFRATEGNVIDFFGEASMEILDVAFVETQDGRQTGDAYVELLTDGGAEMCMTYNRRIMGTRYIEVIESSAMEREVALTTHRYRLGLNRTHAAAAAAAAAQMMPRGGDMAQLLRMQQQVAPAVPLMPSITVGSTVMPAVTPYDMDPSWALPMAPSMSALTAMTFQTMMYQQQLLLVQQQQQQQLAFQQQQQQYQQRGNRRRERQQQVQGPQRFCVRIRGLPFSANEAMIAEFFDDVKIPRQGVHMVLNLQDKPTGEAFVEVETDEDVQMALNHNGGALLHRYIEVFRSSIADMNRLGGADPLPAAGIHMVGPGGALDLGMPLPDPSLFNFFPPMMPMLPGGMPFGFPPVPQLPGLPGNVKVDVKPNEEYLRWYNENKREDGAPAASSGPPAEGSDAPPPQEDGAAEGAIAAEGPAGAEETEAAGTSEDTVQEAAEPGAR